MQPWACRGGTGQGLRTDKFLVIWKLCSWCGDKEQTFLLSGQGDVIEPEWGGGRIW